MYTFSPERQEMATVSIFFSFKFCDTTSLPRMVKHFRKTYSKPCNVLLKVSTCIHKLGCAAYRQENQSVTMININSNVSNFKLVSHFSLPNRSI